MDKGLLFADQGELRSWLEENAEGDGGVWLIFGKAVEPKTLKTFEVLEDALCFGWIDGQMQRIDEVSIASISCNVDPTANGRRRKKLTAELEKRGLITGYGRVKI